MPYTYRENLARLESQLEAATRRRTDLTERAEDLLLEQRAGDVEELTGPDAVRFRPCAATPRRPRN